jgi:hypothetical protein
MNSAKSVLFNLNTIESIMLTSTIMVNLAGIMLLSGRFENLDPEDEFQRDIITYTIILVISTSFFILFCSLVREIRLARRLSKNMARAKWRAVIRKQMAINKKKRAAGRRFQNTVYDMMRKHHVGKLNQSTYLETKSRPAAPAVENLRKGSMSKAFNMNMKRMSLLRKKSVVVKPIQEEVVPRPLLEPQMSDANLESGPQKADLNWLEDDNADVRVPTAPLFLPQYTVGVLVFPLAHCVDYFDLSHQMAFTPTNS